jgi:hypothetical protein
MEPQRTQRSQRRAKDKTAASYTETNSLSSPFCADCIIIVMRDEL